jgi:hypothetical protein
MDVGSQTVSPCRTNYTFSAILCTMRSTNGYFVLYCDVDINQREGDFPPLLVNTDFGEQFSYRSQSLEGYCHFLCSFSHIGSFFPQGQR